MRSLRKLYDHGFIDKPNEQRRGYNDLYCADIYDLDKKGRDILYDELPEVTRLIRQKTDIPVRQFAHAMMICDAMAAIEVGVKKAGHQLVTWQEIVARSSHAEPMRLPCNLRYTFKGGKTETKSTTIVPDGLFGIVQGESISFYALEAEHFSPPTRTTLDGTSTLKKILAYRDIQKSGVYKKQLGIPNMRVLILSPRPSTTDTLVKLTEDIAGKSNLFLFNHIPVQEDEFRTPAMRTDLAGTPWLRAGQAPTSLV